MFDISVWPLLNTYPGDRIELAFSQEVPADTWEDLKIIGPLSFSVELIALENGVDAIIQDLSCRAEYEGCETGIEISSVERTFSKVHDPLLPDDINPIDLKHSTIPFGKILREEILMQIM